MRLFVAEEQNHARLLARLLAAGGVPTLTSHWSDTVFVRLRRLLGLRLELLVLMIAEVVALRYYRALRDGTDDALTSEVAGRILSDERRHVPFHCERLHASLAELPRPARRPAWKEGPAGNRAGTREVIFSSLSADGLLLVNRKAANRLKINKEGIAGVLTNR